MNGIETGKFLFVAGVVLIILGIIFMVGDKIPLGRLPGDLHFGSGRFKVYIPLATSILLSIILTLLLNFFSKR
ncbi:MAG: DUF2905 domain-containing protein [Chitinispirillaceae bacterium]|nr:DUF2905 domain-containing protein [Chitinispirillaceae bacterium]